MNMRWATREDDLALERHARAARSWREVQVPLRRPSAAEGLIRLQQEQDERRAARRETALAALIGGPLVAAVLVGAVFGRWWDLGVAAGLAVAVGLLAWDDARLRAQEYQQHRHK